MTSQITWKTGFQNKSCRKRWRNFLLTVPPRCSDHSFLPLSYSLLPFLLLYISIVFLLPPLTPPHFHCFLLPTTTTRDTTYLIRVRTGLQCISSIINMKKQRRKIKNVVSSDKQHAKTNSDIICFITKDCSLIFIC